MSKYSRERFDVLVVGGGPAGIAAAVRAAESGARVGLVDENLSVGGQIWRGGASDGQHSSDALTWIEQLKKSGVTLLCGKRVFHQPASSVLMAESTADVCELGYRNLILATGARERFLPFPGWTLPNVMGAGGLQAMVKSGLPIRGKRVVVAGSGPLLLAVVSYLRKQGAKILLICEQASGRKLARFAFALMRYPGKIAQAFDLRKDIARIPLATSSWPLCAHGEQKFEAVTISRNGTPETIQCDYLACGFHLVPNTELPTLLGCRIRNGYVQVNNLQQTTAENIFCAGEPTGIGGVDLALVEGQIAGLAAAGNITSAQQLFSKRERFRQFARLLDETFCLRSELRSLPSAETLICRCEDVPYSRLREHTCWRAAKLQTRCGMGPCQGRICGPATQFLFRWNPDSVRPPVFPARVEDLAVQPQAIAEVTGELQ
ncbi:MAG TPA: FAD/NAD(P)-binding oxidoreductase [Candidatus Sulfotelmatobacter sp.]|nr:FAD/NAD(P)-binding oxidoreductase [Candidatus Sulfotelmatobacter sp.]